MKNYLLLFLAIILTVHYSYGNKEENICSCPKSIFFPPTLPSKIFKFSNGSSMSICSHRLDDSLGKSMDHPEFFIFVCGQDSVVARLNFLLSSFGLRQIEDTLIADDYPNLPIGKDFQLDRTLWSSYRFYFIDGKLKTKQEINKKIRRYGVREIALTLSKYEDLKDFHSNLNDSSLAIVLRLFVATISGNLTARKYFKDIPKKYSLDGNYSEIYSELAQKLVNWDAEN